MSKCSAFLMGLTFFEIKIHKQYKEINWKDYLRKIIKQAGAKQIKTLFFVKDSQIKREVSIQDISSLLYTGEVPKLLVTEDWDEIYSDLRLLMKERDIPESKDNV